MTMIMIMTGLMLDTDNRLLLERVDKFCCLGDTIIADEGYDLAVTARVENVRKFQDDLSILIVEGVYTLCKKLFDLW